MDVPDLQRHVPGKKELRLEWLWGQGAKPRLSSLLLPGARVWPRSNS